MQMITETLTLVKRHDRRTKSDLAAHGETCDFSTVRSTPKMSTMTGFKSIFQHFYHHATAKKKPREIYMIVTFKEDKHLRERFSSCRKKHATQRSNGSDGPERLSFVNAVCVCLCLQTETNHRVFSYSCCAHFLALIRSPARVCLSCQRWGGRRQIRWTNYENVLHPGWKRGWKKTMESKLLWYSKARKPYGANNTSSSCS